MNKHKQEANRAHWLQHVSAWNKSGVTQSAYCRGHGLSANLFSAWVGRAKKRSAELSLAPPTIVPLVIEPDHVTATLDGAPILLQHKSGWQLSLPSGTQVIWLGNLLSQLV